MLPVITAFPSLPSAPKPQIHKVPSVLIADVKVLPAVINYYNQTTTSINMMVPLSKDKNYTLHHGQVLVHLTPMFDNKVDVVRHLVSQQEYERMKSAQHTPTFLNKYMQINVAKKKFLDCPYYKEQ